MKKVKLLLLSLLVLFMLPISVLADGPGPQLHEYDVRVTNPDGAKALDYDYKTQDYKEIKVPFDTIITIAMEVTHDGELYGESWNESYLVRLSDCTVVDKELDLSSFDNAGGKLYVYSEGAYLYKGPAKAYGKASNTMIPVGTTLNYTYSDGIFAYTEYKGTKGWVYVGNVRKVYEELPSVASYVYKLELTSFEEIKIYEKNDKTSTVIGTIPKNVKFKPIYNLTLDCYNGEGSKCSIFYYVTYNGKSGWIEANYNVGYPSNDVMLYGTEYDYMVDDSINMSKEIKIPKNTLLISDYVIIGSEDIYRFKYKDTYVYRYANWEENLTWISKYKLVEDVKEYDNYEGTELTSTQKAGTIEGYLYDRSDEGWLYVANTKKWIKVTPTQLLDLDGEKVIYEQGDEPVEPVDPEPVKPINPSSNTTTPTKANGISTRQIVLYSVIGSLVLVLILLVIIILVNKGKKAPKEEVKPETKTEEKPEDNKE